MVESQSLICNMKTPRIIHGSTVSPTKEDVEIIQKIKTITARGNDVEIRMKRDGKLAIYEIKKRVV